MTRKQLVRYTDEVHSKFLDHYAIHGRITKAAKYAGVHVSVIYQQKKIHPTLTEDMELALEKYRDILENEARRRGVEGTVKDIYYQGEVVGEERQYSDRLLEMLLKKERPHEFRERKEITGAGGGPLEINIVQFDDNPPPVIDAESIPTKELKDANKETSPETQGQHQEESHDQVTPSKKEEEKEKITVEIDPMTKILGKLGLDE